MGIEQCKKHGVKSANMDKNAVHMIVAGSEFVPHAIKTISNQWGLHELKRISEVHHYYLGQEMLDIALMCAYYANEKNFSVHVQRVGKNIQLVSVKKTNVNKMPQLTKIDSVTNKNNRSLLGADLEIMMRNEKTNAFVAFPMSDKWNKKIGADRALLRKGTTFYQPILELRATPKKTGAMLHDEFVTLKRRLVDRLKNEAYSLSIVAEENPKGRFLLGGHFHISNKRPSYRTTSLLDALVTLPFTTINQPKSLERRNTYGKLGSVRLNRFNGYEYRTLPSWFTYIDDGAPLFIWIETIFFNKTIPEIRLNDEAIRAYYEGKNEVLIKKTEYLFSYVTQYLTDEEKINLENFKLWLQLMRMLD
ncbi:putative amidoligase domain-containing protein [Evansella cellulosilytica]|uniref:Uncharacterized protein n=1 Tax=Evansella cellulosilytica (strain ATCC 21833 / DSM 2522 / FERM P-1141 / JCM 9156 / N-4) TaxID=649639 RepID=E6TS20_EVAC2|nr:hypothetical protein [Evansella cellulosilytica]ADU30674.1 hypothetical protein Bcell_2417 [Evansella cellulosilytica DSM 2522]